MAPGSRALAFVSRWFDTSNVHHVFEPLVADWQREWQDARPLRRPWVSVRGWLAFVCAVIVSSPRALLAPTPPGVARRVAWRVTLMVVIAATLLLIPAVPEMSAAPLSPWLVLLVLPSTLTLALPFAMIVAVDAIRCHDDLPEHVERAAALKVALAAMLFMVAFGGWVVPAATREFHAVSEKRADTLTAAVRELSNAELLSVPAGTPQEQAVLTPVIRHELRNRASLVMMPALLLLLRWQALDLPRHRRFSPLKARMLTTVGIASIFMLTWSATFIEDLMRLTGVLGAMMIAAFGSWSLAEQTWRRPSTHQEA
jgi:hypothetical protein